MLASRNHEQNRQTAPVVSMRCLQIPIHRDSWHVVSRLAFNMRLGTATIFDVHVLILSAMSVL
jgi:hypothetical protein